jgi:ABC-type glycerol-3-phosphate transport system substrate-binding protein
MLLVLVMTLGLLAGCKKKEETKADEGDRTLTVGIPQDSNIPDYETNAFALYLEETLNADIEWDYFARNGANYQRQLTLRCTGEEDLPDVILLKMTHYLLNQFGEDGYIMDLRPFIDKYGKNFK